MRVLLVEDEAEMAQALRAALKKYDMVMDHAPTLADAAEAATGVHDAILLDRRLPDGTAEGILPRLRGLAPRAAVLIVTGLALIRLQ